MNVIGKCSWHVSSVIPIIVTLSRHNFTTTSISELFKTRSTLSENEFCRSSKVFRVVFTRFGTEILPKQSASIPARARALTTQDQDEREPEGAEKWRISDCRECWMGGSKLNRQPRLGFFGSGGWCWLENPIPFDSWIDSWTDSFWFQIILVKLCSQVTNIWSLLLKMYWNEDIQASLKKLHQIS